MFITLHTADQAMLSHNEGRAWPEELNRGIRSGWK